MHVRRLAAASVCAVALAVPQPAQALVPRQVAVTGAGYVLSEVSIFEGDTLTLTNLDPQLEHDLVSLDRKAGGAYLFRTDPIKGGKQALVVGVESLRPRSYPGVYPFYCSLHEYMKGNITVDAPPAAR